MSTADGKKIAIVTGSALGLGYELARQLIAKGWFVAGIDFNGARQAELSKTFAADEYRAFVGDISDESFVKNSVAAISKIGHIDLLINNAGQPSFKVPTAYEAADVDKCLKGLKGMVLWSVEILKAESQNRQRHVYCGNARQPQRIRVLRHQVGREGLHQEFAGRIQGDQCENRGCLSGWHRHPVLP